MKKGFLTVILVALLLALPACEFQTPHQTTADHSEKQTTELTTTLTTVESLTIPDGTSQEQTEISDPTKDARTPTLPVNLTVHYQRGYSKYSSKLSMSGDYTWNYLNRYGEIQTVESSEHPLQEASDLTIIHVADPDGTVWLQADALTDAEVVTKFTYTAVAYEVSEQGVIGDPVPEDVYPRIERSVTDDMPILVGHYYYELRVQYDYFGTDLGTVTYGFIACQSGKVPSVESIYYCKVQSCESYTGSPKIP